MEVENRRERKHMVYGYEFMGTAMLLIAINWGAGGDQAAAVAVMYFFNIVVFGPVSGGHFNPAVTFAVLVSNNEGRMEKEDTNFAKFIMLA